LLDQTRKEVTGLDLDADRGSFITNARFVFISSSMLIYRYVISSERRQSPNYLLKFVTSHRNVVRCAKFTPDGKYVASGSADTSIKLIDVQKMMTSTQQRTDGGVEEVNMSRPVIRIFYDHIQVNTLTFLHWEISVLKNEDKKEQVQILKSMD
jgi:WD40 repeat protein